MSESNTPIPVNPSGGTGGVVKTLLTQHCDPMKCEIAIQVGIFFDGTGNALDGSGNTAPQWQHEVRRKHSNVARLFRTYPEKPIDGLYPLHIAGIGTPMVQIGEDDARDTGSAFGRGGDGRIHYGLLHVFNSVHRAITGSRRRAMFDGATVKALCRNGRRDVHVDRHGRPHYGALAEAEDEQTLARVDMDKAGGLLLDAYGRRAHAQAFYMKQAARLQNLISNVADKPVLKEIFVDVFGFSRGSAQARTFCNWLDEIFQGSRLFGVVAHIRFLGLFDTVASVGVNASVGVGAQGHMSWADAGYLRVPRRVQHCEHYVAMHENRPSFPLEFVEVAGVRPSNCRQFGYPGMHSDVGGGYLPGEQGRWLGANERPDVATLDSMKLSQVPLRHMFNSARAAGVPLDMLEAQRSTSQDVFAIHPELQRSFDAFMAQAGEAKPLREWLTPFLAWRYQVRDRYATFSATQRASADDKEDLIGANRTLLLDIDALENAGVWQMIKDSFGLATSLGSIFESRTQRAAQLAPEAPQLLQSLKKHPPIPSALATVFQFLAHDSFAGFRPFDQIRPLGVDIVPGSWEAEGYLRYRRRYEGDDKALVRHQTFREESIVA